MNTTPSGKLGAQIVIETHGCKLNMADSQRLANQFLREGFNISLSGGSVDVFILNSCTVTATADSKARHALRSARRRYPNALIVACGCYPERAPDDVANFDFVDVSVGNRDKEKLVRIVSEKLAERAWKSVHSTNVSLISKGMTLGRSRASVKIQEGCNQVCAYCIVPKVRGRERSITPESIVAQIEELTQAGYGEVVLTGTQLGTYGFDLKEWSLTSMLKLVLDKTNVPRIRVSSLQPQEIGAELLDLWITRGEGRLCPHFHIPLQSGSDEILRRMRRRYTAADFLRTVERVRRAVPDCSISTDVIVGFNGETSADYDATRSVVEQVGFARVHIFPYSVRPGTSGAYMDKAIDSSVKKMRADDLRNLARFHARKYAESFLGNIRSVLWEGTWGYSGLTDNYLKVRLVNPDKYYSSDDFNTDGSIGNVRLLYLGDEVIFCELV